MFCMFQRFRVAEEQETGKEKRARRPPAGIFDIYTQFL